MDICEESSRLAELIEKSILNIFVNDRDLFLDLLDEDSVLVSAGSQVFYGRTSYERWPPNPPGVVARDVRFHPLYTNQPDEATIVGTYLLSGPCIEGTVNQRVTTNLKKVDGKWKIRLSHFSNEWPKDKANTPPPFDRKGVRRATAPAENERRDRFRGPRRNHLCRVPREKLRAPSQGPDDNGRPAFAGPIRSAIRPVRPHEPFLSRQRVVCAKRWERRH